MFEMDLEDDASAHDSDGVTAELLDGFERRFPAFRPPREQMEAREYRAAHEVHLEDGRTRTYHHLVVHEMGQVRYKTIEQKVLPDP